MLFDNYGSVWSIDHVIPCYYFDVTNDKELHKCFNWSNLQPFKKIKNQEKVNKVTIKEINEHYRKVRKFKEDHVIDDKENDFDQYDKTQYIKNE